jgi:hypothetical protein
VKLLQDIKIIQQSLYFIYSEKGSKPEQLLSSLPQIIIPHIFTYNFKQIRIFKENIFKACDELNKINENLKTGFWFCSFN